MLKLIVSYLLFLGAGFNILFGGCALIAASPSFAKLLINWRARPGIILIISLVFILFFWPYWIPFVLIVVIPMALYSFAIVMITDDEDRAVVHWGLIIDRIEAFYNRLIEYDRQRGRLKAE